MDVGQRIQQTGFANVRSATKCDLRFLISGKFSRSCCTLDEPGRVDSHVKRPETAVSITDSLPSS
jgi:hypothetical protein